MSAIVAQSSFVSKTGTPSAIAPVGSDPGVALVDRSWEPQSLFVHDWQAPVTVQGSWTTVVSKSRNGLTQRYAISDKPKLTVSSVTRCFNGTHWLNLREMISKQELCRYMYPLHSDPCHGVTLLDPQEHRYSVKSPLSTRRLFVGQYAFISTVDSSSMWKDFTLSKIEDIDRTSNIITFDSPLRASTYREPSIETKILKVTGKNEPGSWPGNLWQGPWGYASGVNVNMWVGKNWATAGSATVIGGNATTATGIAQVVISKANAVLVKPGDQIVHIAYTMCRNNQTIDLAPTAIRPVQGGSSATPSWSQQLSWTESGVVGGSTPNNNPFSHQRVGVATPAPGQIRTTKLVIRTTTITKAMCDGFAQADTGQNSRGECQVVVQGTVTSGSGTSTTSDNAIMQAVIVVRNGFAQVAGQPATMVHDIEGLFMGHFSTSGPTGADSDYPSGTVFPNLVQTIAGTSNAPKSKMVALQVMTYGNAVTPDPVYATQSPNLSTSLYPTTETYPDITPEPTSSQVNVVRASAANNNDVLVRIHQITDTTAQEDPPQQIARSYSFTSRYDATTPAPTSPALTPFMFSVGLLLNPSIPEQDGRIVGSASAPTMRIYPAIEADASPSSPQVLRAQTSEVGVAALNAVQTTGKAAIYSPDMMNALGQTVWDTAVYPKFQSNPKKTAGCNPNSSYPTTSVDAPLLLGKFDYESGVSVGVGSSVGAEPVGIGRSIEAYSEKPYNEFSMAVRFITRAAAWKFLELWNNRRGRLLPVWLPNPTKSLVITGSDQPSFITFNDADVATSAVHGSKYLYLAADDGSHYIVSIAGYSRSDSQVVATVDTTLTVGGGQTCGLLTALKTLIDTGRIVRTTTAHLCFFDSDELVENWRTDEVMETSFRLIEVQDFAPDDQIGVLTPSTGCGACCGSSAGCLCIGGSYRGCPESDGQCCLCMTPTTKLRVVIYCYDGCITTDPDRDPTTTPYQCPTFCNSRGTPCSPTGLKEYEVPLDPAVTQCDRVGFRLSSSSCGDDAVFALDLDTGIWDTLATGFMDNHCCGVPGCLCLTSACCILPNCFTNCGPNRVEHECTRFKMYQAWCGYCPNPPPNTCPPPRCGQGGATRQGCCGGLIEGSTTNTNGRLIVEGQIFNEFVDLENSTGCPPCIGCTS